MIRPFEWQAILTNNRLYCPKELFRISTYLSITYPAERLCYTYGRQQQHSNTKIIHRKIDGIQHEPKFWNENKKKCKLYGLSLYVLCTQCQGRNFVYLYRSVLGLINNIWSIYRMCWIQNWNWTRIVTQTECHSNMKEIEK